MNANTARNNGVSSVDLLLVLGLLIGSALLAGGATTTEAETCCSAQTQESQSVASTKQASADLASRWGIEVNALRLSANGNMLDFRYRVIDPEKAAILGSAKIKPVLIDQESGAQLHVPSMPKVGQLRSTQRLVAGKIYTALFANPGAAVKKGQLVTIVFGDFRAENLTVSD